jgi:tetratricopeptide (TPR) repeat protein
MTPAEGASRAEAESLYRIAVAKKSRGDLEGARRDCERALMLQPSHREARVLFRTLNDLMSHPGPLAADETARLHEVRRRQSLIEIENAMSEGERLQNAGEFERALFEYRRAETMILAMPEETARGTYLAVVRQKIKEVR